MGSVSAYFDGSCEPINPGGTAKWGFVILKEGEIIHHANGVIGKGEGMTSNVAEYHALQACLEFLTVAFPDEEIEIFGDSKMVINMVNETWGRSKPHRKAPHLKKVLERCKQLAAKLPYSGISWVPREENELADFYSKQ